MNIIWLTEGCRITICPPAQTCVQCSAVATLYNDPSDGQDYCARCWNQYYNPEMVVGGAAAYITKHHHMLMMLDREPVSDSFWCW